MWVCVFLFGAPEVSLLWEFLSNSLNVNERRLNTYKVHFTMKSGNFITNKEQQVDTVIYKYIMTVRLPA